MKKRHMKELLRSTERKLRKARQGRRAAEAAVAKRPPPDDAELYTTVIKRLLMGIKGGMSRARRIEMSKYAIRRLHSNEHLNPDVAPVPSGAVSTFMGIPVFIIHDNLPESFADDDVAIRVRVDDAVVSDPLSPALRLPRAFGLDGDGERVALGDVIGWAAVSHLGRVIAMGVTHGGTAEAAKALDPARGIGLQLLPITRDNAHRWLERAESDAGDAAEWGQALRDRSPLADEDRVVGWAVELEGKIVSMGSNNRHAINRARVLHPDQAERLLVHRLTYANIGEWFDGLESRGMVLPEAADAEREKGEENIAWAAVAGSQVLALCPSGTVLMEFARHHFSGESDCVEVDRITRSNAHDWVRRMAQQGRPGMVGTVKLVNIAFQDDGPGDREPGKQDMLGRAHRALSDAVTAAERASRAVRACDEAGTAGAGVFTNNVIESLSHAHGALVNVRKLAEDCLASVGHFDTGQPGSVHRDEA